jgi:hypothetical protein
MKDINTKHAYFLLLVVIALTTAIYYTSFRSGHIWGGDFAQYIYQAKGIAEGRIDEVIQASHYRYENSTHSVGPKYYPWGFPLLLSPVYRVFGLHIPAMRAYITVFFLLSLFVLFLLFKDRLTNKQALLLVIVLALNPYCFHLKDLVASDIPFLLFALLSIFAIQRIVIAKKTWVNGYVSYAAIGLFIFLSYYIRTVGGLLLGVLLICQYVDQRQSRRKITSYVSSNRSVIIPYLVFLILMIISGFILPTVSRLYLEDLKPATAVGAAANIKHYLMIPADFFGPFKFSLILYGITIPFAVLGILRNVKKDYLYLALMVLTLATLIPFPFHQGVRYILWLLPFYIYFVFTGLSSVSAAEVIPSRYNWLSLNLVHGFSILLILVFCLGLFLIRTHRAKVSILSGAYTWNLSGSSGIVEGPYTGDSRDLFLYIRENTSERDAVIFWKPRVMTLYTDRRSAHIRGYEAMVASDAQYAVQTRQSEGHLGIDSFVEEHPESFELVFENKSFAAYKIKRRSSADAPLQRSP